MITITVEGPVKSGKSTLATIIANTLRHMGMDVTQEDLDIVPLGADNAMMLFSNIRGGRVHVVEKLSRREV